MNCNNCYVYYMYLLKSKTDYILTTTEELGEHNISTFMEEIKEDNKDKKDKYACTKCDASFALKVDLKVSKINTQSS